MTTLNDFSVTDSENWVLAEYYNILLGSIVRHGFTNATVLSVTTYTLNDADTAVQVFDCNGDDRIVKLPPTGPNNHPYVVKNHTGTDHVLTIKSNDEATIIQTLMDGEIGLIVPDGTGSYSAVTVNYLHRSGLTEWNEQSGDPPTPSANTWKLYFKPGGLFHEDDAGNVVGPLGTGGGGGGSSFWATVPGTPVRASNTEFTITDENGESNHLWKLSAGRVVRWLDSGEQKIAKIQNAWLSGDTVRVIIKGDTLTATATMASLKVSVKLPGREFFVREWVSRTSAADNSWYSVCWSPELDLFVAVSESGTGNRVMTSPDGINWTTRTSAANNNWRSVCWSAELGLFAAVASSGTGNRVMTSPDGINWTIRTSAADNIWNSVCWSPELSLFVAVSNGGTGNRVMTSPDGINWTIRTSAADNNWRSVCWSAELGLFAAVASSGTGDRVMTSPDGINWTIRTSAADNSWNSVCWSPELSLFVAVAESGGASNRVMTSPDGINWTIRTSPASIAWNSVCWSPEFGLFVAVGTDNVMTSPDGINWTIRTSAASNQWRSICWSPELSLFVVVGQTGSGNRVMTSVRSIRDGVVEEHGARPVWNSASGYQVEAGRRNVNGVITGWASPIVRSSLSLSSNTFYYIYLYSNAGTPALEESTTVCVWNSTYRYWQKTGDATRRFVGGFRTDGSGNIVQWVSTINGNTIEQIAAEVNIITTTASAGAWSTVNLTGVVPANAATHWWLNALAHFTSDGDEGIVGVSPIDQGSTVAAGGYYTARAATGRAGGVFYFGRAWIPIETSLTAYYRTQVIAGAVTASIRCVGFRFTI